MDGRRRSSPQNRYLPSIFSGRRGNSRTSKASNAGTVSEPSSPGANSSVDSAKKSQKRVKQVFHYYFTRKSRRKSSGSPSQCSVVSSLSQAPAPPLVSLGAEARDLSVQKAMPPTCRLLTAGNLLDNNGASVILEDTTGKSMGDPPSPASLVEHQEIKPLSRSNPFEDRVLNQKSSSLPQVRTVQQKDADDVERLKSASSLKCQGLRSTVTAGFRNEPNASQTDESDTRSLRTEYGNEHTVVGKASHGKEGGPRVASDDDDDDPFKVLASGRNRGPERASGKSDLSSTIGYDDDIPGATHQPGAEVFNSTVFDETSDFVSTKPFNNAERYEGRDLFHISRAFGPEIEAREFVQSYSERFLEDKSRDTPVTMFEEGSKTETVPWSESTESRPITVCIAREEARCYQGFVHMEDTATAARDGLPPAPPPSPSDEVLFVATKEFSTPNRDPHDVEDEEVPRPPHILSEGPMMFPSLSPAAEKEQEIMFMPHGEQREEGESPEVDLPVDGSMAVSMRAVPERHRIRTAARTPPNVQTAPFSSRSESDDHAHSRPVLSSLHRHRSPSTTKEQENVARTSVARATPLGDGNDFFDLPLQAARLPKPLTPKPPPPPPSHERTANQDELLITGLPEQPYVPTMQKPPLRRRHLADEGTSSDNTPPAPPQRQPASERSSRDMGIQADTMGSAGVDGPSVSTQTIEAPGSWVDTALKKLEQVELKRASSAESVPQEEKWTIPLWALIVFIVFLNVVAHYYGMRLRCGRPYCN